MNIQPAFPLQSGVCFTSFCLGKGHAHRWDLLTSDMKKFKALIDKDGFFGGGLGALPGFLADCFEITKTDHVSTCQFY